MQFGHLGIALAIASLDPRPETFAVVTAAQFLPNADSLVIRAGWARPEFHGTWSHNLAFCVAVGAAAALLFGPWLGCLAFASIVAHVAADLPTDTGIPWLLAFVGPAGASLAEAVNYRLVDWAAELPKLAALGLGRRHGGASRHSCARRSGRPCSSSSRRSPTPPCACWRRSASIRCRGISAPSPWAATRGSCWSPRRAHCCAFRCRCWCSRASVSCSPASAGDACSGRA